MLIITKENNSIKVVGQNNPTYPYSGTLVYPLNSVTVVTDQSDMAVFRSALNNDVLFTGLIENITIAGSPVTKEDIGTKFGAIANSASTGGGGTGGGAVDSVNGQTGTVVLTAADVNAYSKTESDEKYATKGEIPSTDDFATKEELAGYALNASLEAEVTERQKQDSALGGMIAGETQAREQAINNLTTTVQGKLDTATYNQEKAGFATKEELNGKQNTLVSGTNIKTINSQSLLGEGNIEITVEGGGISDAPSDGKLYGRKNAQWTEVVIPDTSDFVTKDELNGKANLDGAEFTGNVAVPDLSINDSRDGVMFNVSKQSRDILFRTMNAGIDSVSFQVQNAYPLKLTEAGIMENNQLLETKYAKVDDIPTDYITNEDLTPYETKENAQATYQIKGDYALKSEVPTQYVQSFTGTDTGFQILQAGSSDARGGLTFGEGFTVVNSRNTPSVSIDTETIATKTELQGKQDTLVSGTNIKTVNGNSLLGSGNITISGGGGGTETYDFKGTSRCAELTYDVVKEGVILQNITLSGMNITTNGVLITLAKFDNTSAVGFALLSEGKYNGTNKPFLAQVLFSNVGGATISKYVSTTSTPTLQEGAEGTETNYVYSKKSDPGHRVVSMASPGVVSDGEGSSTAGLVLQYWGDDVTKPLKFDYATSTRGGMMRSRDKNKLDTMPSQWFGTQSQFDGLDSKDENTLYFITEE